MDRAAVQSAVEAAVESAVLAGSKSEAGRRQLSCARAHVLAEDFDVPLGVIGSVCEQHDIKLTGCQLGCFGKSRKHD